MLDNYQEQFIARPVLRAAEKNKLPYLESTLRNVGKAVVPKIDFDLKTIVTTNPYDKNKFAGFKEELAAVGETFGKDWENQPDLIGYYSFLSTLVKGGEKTLTPWLLTTSKNQIKETWQNGRLFWQELIKKDQNIDNKFITDIESGLWQLPNLKTGLEEKLSATIKKPPEKMEKSPLTDLMIEGGKRIFLANQIAQLLPIIKELSKKTDILKKLNSAPNNLSDYINKTNNCSFNDSFIGESLQRLIKDKDDNFGYLLKNNRQELLQILHALYFEKWSYQAQELTYMRKLVPENAADFLGGFLPYVRTKTVQNTMEHIKIDAQIHDLTTDKKKIYVNLPDKPITIPIDDISVDSSQVNFYCRSSDDSGSIFFSVPGLEVDF